MTRTFIDHLNHEIRSPLTVLVGMTELLALADLPADQRQYLGTMQQAVQSILKLMDSAVDFSRLNAGTLSLRKETFELGPLLDEISRSVSEICPGASLSVAVAEDVSHRLVGDAARTRQAIACLVNHAIQVQGRRQLALGVTARRRSADCIELSFSCGLPGAMRMSCDDGNLPPGKFVECSEAALSGSFGPGLELAIAAGLAALMQGKLWIAASKDSALTARLAARFELPQLSETAATPAANPVRGRREGRRILLADDTRANQQLLARLLRDRGHLVVTANNGMEAVELFEAQSELKPFDVVILDLEMPIMDGWQAAKEMRKLDPLGRAPLVALTAHRVEGAAELLGEGAFDAALSKPVGAQRLFEVVEGLNPPASEIEAETEADNQRSLVDFRGALSRLGGNEQLLDELAEFFLEDGPELLAEARAAIDRQDARSLERTAHSIRGLAANFGAQSTVQAAAALEAIGRNGELAAADLACQTLEAELGKLTLVLEDRVRRAT